MAVIGALLLALSGCQREEGGEITGVTRGDTPRPVRPLVFIGLDGAEWDVIEKMIGAGELPNMADLIERGASAHLLNPIPMVSPVVWTSFVTGHFGRQHGILDFVYPYQEGPKKPVESLQRREPAIWNILSEQGKTATALGFFVSHPAEHVNGAVVSEYAFQGAEGAFWPESLANRLAANLLFPDSARQSAYERFFPWPFDGADADDPESPFFEPTKLVSGRVSGRVIGDEYLRRVAQEMAAEPVDFFGAYYRIIDIASHSLWLYYDDRDFEQKADPRLQALLGEIIPEAYRFADEVIGEILAAQNPKANVVIVSDHGFGSSTGPYEVRDDAYKMLTGNHRPDGILIAAGPDIAPGEYTDITVMEILPTLMALMGQPVSDELPGHVEARLIRPDFLADHPVRYVDAYATNWSANASEVDAATQQETMQTLQGLGYIGDGVELQEGGANQDFEFWSIEPRLIVSHLHGEVAYHLLQGDTAAAESVLKEVVQMAPDLMPVMLARVKAKLEAIQEEGISDREVSPSAFQLLARYEN